MKIHPYAAATIFAALTFSSACFPIGATWPQMVRCSCLNPSSRSGIFHFSQASSQEFELHKLVPTSRCPCSHTHTHHHQIYCNIIIRHILHIYIYIYIHSYLYIYIFYGYDIILYMHISCIYIYIHSSIMKLAICYIMRMYIFYITAASTVHYLTTWFALTQTRW